MPLEKINITKNLKKDAHLHSKEHVLADDLSREMREPKKFAAYLGIAKLYHESDLRALAKYILAKKDLEPKNRGKYFFGALRRLSRKEGAKLKNLKERKNKQKMMKINAIVKNPNLILRKEARTLDLHEIKTPKIKGLVANMKETLKNTVDGVGLAAPQVGESLRLFIVSEEAEEINKLESGRKEPLQNYEEIRKKKEWKNYVFINPVVKNTSRAKLERAEGCLSVPGKYGIVKRNEKITVEAYDENGKKFTRGASGFVARVIQHELDHLKGTLFIDKAEKMIEPEKK